MRACGEVIFARFRCLTLREQTLTEMELLLSVEFLLHVHLETETKSFSLLYTCFH